MGQWLTRVWHDEEAFTRALRVLARFGLAFIGYLMDLGIIPTGVEAGGTKFGMLGIVCGFLISSTKIDPKKPTIPAHTSAPPA